MIEGLRRTGRELTRARLLTAMRALKMRLANMDLDFTGSGIAASRFVELVQVRFDGKYVRGGRQGKANPSLTLTGSVHERDGRSFKGIRCRSRVAGLWRVLQEERVRRHGCLRREGVCFCT